jgi:hypothetical protein
VSESRGFRIDFGRHCGKWISDDSIPRGYLKWLVTECDRLEPWQVQAVAEELTRRGERLLPAADVLNDLDDEVIRAVTGDDNIPFEICARVGDAVLEAFEAVRERWGIGQQTALHVPAQHEPRRPIDAWRDGEG